MTALRSSGELKVRADGTTKVRVSVYLDGDAWMQCCTYPDRAPVLTVSSGPVDVSVGVPDCGHVTAEDVARARQLAAAVAEFVTDLERCAVLGDQGADSAGQAA